MRPPICDICNRDFDSDLEGGLFYFKETTEGKEFDRRVEEEGITGHPPDAGWFCGKHITQAQKLVHLSIGKALNAMKETKYIEIGS